MNTASIKASAQSTLDALSTKFDEARDSDFATMVKNVDYVEVGSIALGVVAASALMYLGLSAALAIFTAAAASMGTLVACIAWAFVAQLSLSFAVGGFALSYYGARFAAQRAPAVASYATEKLSSAKAWFAARRNPVTA